MSHLVIQTEHLDDAWAAWMAQRAELVQAEHGTHAFDDAIARASALVVRTYTAVDRALLDRAPNLKVVGRAGVGLENIDIDACAERGVRVVYTPDANSVAVVELVVAFLLDALRPRVFLDAALPKGEWKALRAELLAEKQLSQITLGILGFGRIGSRLARSVSGLVGRVIYTDLRTIDEGSRCGALPVSVEDLFAQSDAVSVHIDHRAANRHAVGARLLGLMRDDALLINASRGFVVDHAALADRLRERPTMRAMLDVHDPEPIAPGNPLLGLPNAFLSPHIAAATRLAHSNMSRVVEDVWRVLEGEAPEWEMRAEDMIR